MFTYRIFKRFYFFLLLMIAIICIGTAGYVLIEGWEVFDAFYMTIITITTVGFGEIHELSQVGRLFTAFLIITCFGTFAYTISMLTSYIVGGEYRINLREYKIMRKVNKMENHIIICGFGRVGRQVASDLRLFGHQFVIIEKDENTIAQNEHEKGYTFLKGDSTQEGILENAGIERAKALITCLPKDADNIYVVLSARQVARSLNIVARSSSSSAVSKLKIAGADHVIIPDSIGGAHMAALINNADVVEFLDAIKVQGNSGVNIEAISFNELPEEFRNKTIGQLEAKRITGVTIIGFKTPEGEYIINPDFDIEVVPQSKLFVLGSPKQIRKLNELFGIQHTL